MADKKTAPKKVAAKRPAEKAPVAKAPVAKPPAEKKAKASGWARRAKGGEDKACGIEGCKRPYRAKGYCYFHFKKWRQGELPHGRYRTCSKPDCRSKAVRHGLCEKHEAETYGKAVPAESAA